MTTKAAAMRAIEDAEIEAGQKLESVQRLTKDLKAGAMTLTERQARYLVDMYYAIQDYRIRVAAQMREADKAEEPHAILGWLFGNCETLEQQIKRALEAYARSRRVGRWMLSQHGIGPVIAAGLLAHIDVRRAKTAGAIWRFAGLDPTVSWEKGQKRPWNARLKLLCWKIGQSFMKFHRSEDCYYGKIYAKRKAVEQERNDAGMYREQAQQKLEKFKIKDAATREKYEAGELPDGRLELRAERYAVKIFLSHLHQVMYEAELGQPAPVPFVIAHGEKRRDGSVRQHVHVLEPPNWPID